MCVCERERKNEHTHATIHVEVRGQFSGVGPVALCAPGIEFMSQACWYVLLSVDILPARLLFVVLVYIPCTH